MQGNFATRLKHFIDSEGLTSSQFADICKIPRPTLTQLLASRSKKISDIVIGQIHQGFPKLNILWLMFGEGDMYGSGCQGSSEPFFPSTDSSEENVESSDGSGNADLETDTSKISAENFNTPNHEEEYPDRAFSDSGSSKMRIENSINADNRRNLQFHGNLNALNTPQNTPGTRMNTGIEAEYKILNLQRQIDEMRQNPRRVTQITIYYDDSTFETFVPKQ